MTFCKIGSTVATMAALLLLLPASSRAQGFISGAVGVASGGDTFDNEPTTYAFSAGALGEVVGVELEIAFTPDFFTDSALVDDNRVTTVMGNLLVGPRLGALRPYAAGGIGLMRLSVQGPFGVGDYTRNDLAVNVGGGVMGFISPAVGVRGDVRYVRNLNDNNEEFGLDFDQFDYWRSTVGLVIRF